MVELEIVVVEEFSQSDGQYSLEYFPHYVEKSDKFVRSGVCVRLTGLVENDCYCLFPSLEKVACTETTVGNKSKEDYGGQTKVRKSFPEAEFCLKRLLLSFPP